MWQLRNSFQTSEQFSELYERCSSSSGAGVERDSCCIPFEMEELEEQLVQSGTLYDANQSLFAGREDAG
jgi:hypothetical protein